MNARHIVLRNRDVNQNCSITEKSSFTGVTTRKRAALKALENADKNSNIKPINNKLNTKIKRLPLVEEYEPEPMDISISFDNKENQTINYDYVVNNPFVWPKHSELTSKENIEKIQNIIVSRRDAIRVHHTKLNVNKLPIWCFDSDKDDGFNHIQYLPNINDYLIDSELTSTTLGNDYLEKSCNVFSRERYAFIDWVVKIHGIFEMCNDTLYLAISIVDRFIKATKSTIATRDLEITGVISLFIAAKVEEVYPPTLKDILKQLILSYSLDFCKGLEITILQAVQFQLSVPLPISFVRYYNIVIEATPVSHYLSRYFCELSLQDYTASGHSGNLIGASCVFLAQVICYNVTSNYRKVWNEKLEAASGLVFTDFRNLISSLCANVMKQKSQSTYRTISIKYSDNRLLDVYSKALSSQALVTLIKHFQTGSI